MHFERRTDMRIARSIATSTAALLLAGGLASCARNDLKWTEDVRLPDGRVVTLERYVEFKGGASNFGDPSTDSLQRLSFTHPSTGEVIRWESSKEAGRLTTIALWMSQETPRLLVQPTYGGDLIRFKCPNPPYLLVEHVQSQWRSVPLAQIGVDSLRANMTTHLMESGLREKIEGSGLRLNADQTADSYTYRNGNVRVPYVLDFKGMPEQTFRVYENCNQPLNYLLAK
jgi:hypothetical protein